MHINYAHNKGIKKDIKKMSYNYCSVKVIAKDAEKLNIIQFLPKNLNGF